MVIGVVLMVAVVVILAAVIGAFVLGLGGNQNQAPQTSFSVVDDAIIYEGGDSLSGANLTVNGPATGQPPETSHPAILSLLSLVTVR